jgi:hypothetical protein
MALRASKLDEDANFRSNRINNLNRRFQSEWE